MKNVTKTLNLVVQITTTVLRHQNNLLDEWFFDQSKTILAYVLELLLGRLTIFGVAHISTITCITLYTYNIP